MNFLTKALLVLLYVVMLPASLVRRILGRDTLQLRAPPAGASCWLLRGAPPTTESYFSEKSEVEGRPARSENGQLATDPGIARVFAPLFVAAASLHAPPRAVPGEKFSAAADREQGIPDEVYTLW
jgi:hypothetical protein